MEQLQIRMFGEFSVQMGKARISDRDNRSRKVWQLLACLICRRDRTVSQSELIELIWGDDPASDNPENALKVTMHRARAMLDRLWSTAGHDLIVRRGNGYGWNREVPMWLDSDWFETLCRQTCADEEARLACAMEALELYRGEFLNKLSTGTWVIPLATHYHNLYVRTIEETVPMLSARGRYDQAERICRNALSVEPYHEGLHLLLMQALMAQEDLKGAAKVYEELSKQLFHVFGISPGEELRTLYRKAANSISDTSMPMELVLEHLLERDPAAGALQCDFDCFRVLCHAEARAMVRSGHATHVALLSVSGAADKPLSKRSMDTAMKNLSEQMRLNLRRGDAFSRCSVSQYILMLPQANYENSCMVCRRILGAFHRRYPHSPAQINYIVQPLSTRTLER